MKTTSILSKIAIPILIVAILVYLGLSAWMGIRNPYEFVVAYTDTMETSAVANGWVIRHEMPISGGNGLVRLLREREEKVGKGQAIAEVYQDENYEEHQEELRKTQRDLTALQYATYEYSPTGAVLEEQMLSSMANMQTAASTGNFVGMEESTELYRKTVLRREYLVSEEAAQAMDAAGWELNPPFHLISGQSTTTSSSISTTFYRENASTTSRMQKVLSKSLLNPEAWIFQFSSVAQSCPTL